MLQHGSRLDEIRLNLIVIAHITGTQVNEMQFSISPDVQWAENCVQRINEKYI